MGRSEGDGGSGSTAGERAAKTNWHRVEAVYELLTSGPGKTKWRDVLHLLKQESGKSIARGSRMGKTSHSSPGCTAWPERVKLICGQRLQCYCKYSLGMQAHHHPAILKAVTCAQAIAGTKWSYQKTQIEWYVGAYWTSSNPISNAQGMLATDTV